MHDPPRQQEQHEQHAKTVEEADLAEHVEREQAEDRLHLDALQPVGAAGDVGKALRQRLQQQSDPKRHHQAGEVDTPDHQKTGEKADRGGDEAGNQQRNHRLGDDAVQGQQAGGISTDAEERGVAERYNSGVAENEIERQREQSQPHDIRHDQIAGGEQERTRQCENPERDLARAPAPVLDGVVSDIGLRGHIGVNGRRRGRTNRSDARSGSRS